ncbi:kelch repeat and BTB domain-containing protein 8-like [Mizuhopecten yessoensis]|uniref:Actin-binding protein IPP n=1 Tax=Mizuhopecten yessoensis TaxID=6573 RepID=A0A210QSN9_MIZYE|nr:kelch repeat and BTB domain-containing protein 8-like [Mizuhopecten yessoensis]OWF51739.1 Actin-binding protein IPP [Mizuhopecten yessoensis]
MTSQSTADEKQRPEQPSVPHDNQHNNHDISESVDCNVHHYGNTVLPEMYTLWQKGMFCDVKFEVSSKVFSCHSVVIAAVSDYFRRLSRSANGKVIRIRNIKPEIFSDIIQFAYTGTINLKENSVFEMMFACHHFEMTSLVTLCSEYASRFIYPGNCFEVIDFARELSIPSLYRKAIDLVEQNQDSLSLDPEVCYNRMNSSMAFFNDRSIMIKRKGIPITSKRREMYFMQFLVTFVSTNPKELLEAFVEYLKLVNMPLLSHVILTQIFRPQRHLLDNALVQHLLQLSELFRNGTEAEDIPSIWKSSSDRDWSLSTNKAMTHVKLFEYFLQKTVFADKSEIEPDVAVISIEFHFRSVKSFNFLAGIKSVYSDGKKVCHGNCAKYENEQISGLSTNNQTAVLLEEELIVAVDVLYSYAISGITLKTNTGRMLGPFGNSPLPGLQHAMYKVPTIGPYNHLHGFSGTEVEVTDLKDTYILNLAVVWASFDPNSNAK